MRVVCGSVSMRPVAGSASAVSMRPVAGSASAGGGTRTPKGSVLGAGASVGAVTWNLNQGPRWGSPIAIV